MSQRRSGLTLIELLVVVAIIAVLGVILYSAFSGGSGKAEASIRLPQAVWTHVARAENAHTVNWVNVADRHGGARRVRFVDGRLDRIGSN